jgi:hypothetical protein
MEIAMADPVSIETARALRQEASRIEADLLAYEARMDHLQLAYSATVVGRCAPGGCTIQFGVPFSRTRSVLWLTDNAGSQSVTDAI